VFFFPGVMVVALAGGFIMLFGIYFSFTTYGTGAGLLTLAGTIVFNLVIFIIALKSGFWKRFALQDTNTGKVNVILPDEIKVGEEGIALSKIGPIGKALLNDKEYEVRSQGEYIEQQTKIEVTKIHNNQIFVKTKT
jgi:membrane-bound ClpP family serine protease